MYRLGLRLVARSGREAFLRLVVTSLAVGVGVGVGAGSELGDGSGDGAPIVTAALGSGLGGAFELHPARTRQAPTSTAGRRDPTAVR